MAWSSLLRAFDFAWAVPALDWLPIAALCVATTMAATLAYPPPVLPDPSNDAGLASHVPRAPVLADSLLTRA
jgi:hypothetical protein